MEKKLLLLISILTFAQLYSQSNLLRRQFANPAFEYGPWVFWMWMNGNVSKEGITLDLEAMNRIGISGAVLFSSNAGLPQGHLSYASDEWFDYNKYMFAEAERLGMKIMLHNGPGYSITGAPWITPENSMQQVVWTETFVKGDNSLQHIQLPKPFAKMDYYEDALVVAYPSLKGEDNPMQNVLKSANINGKETDKTVLTNYDYDNYVEILVPKGKNEGELVLEFNESFEASSIVIRRKHTDPPHHPYDGPRDNPPVLTLEYSGDGANYFPLAKINMPQVRELDVPVSKNFNTVKAKYYRITSNKDTHLTELVLYAATRLQDWESKANYIAKGNRTADLTPGDISEEYVIDPLKVIDLTPYLSTDGTLTWQTPEGNWTVLRIGHTTTGEENEAAPVGGKGLECDKLGKRGIHAHYNHFLKRLFEEMKPYAGKSFYGITVDSWEAGTQNWTKGFEQEYALRQQKNIAPYIAAFTGRIVGGTSSTEKFLEEIRQLQATMLAENFHQELRNYCHANNLTFASEPYGDGPFNSLEVGKYIDIPLGEFWAHGTYGGSHTNNQAGYLARINSRKIAGAEAFTARPELSKFTEYPAEMKTMGDWMFTNGINRLMYHTYAHQPHSTAKPGMTMGPFGTHFNRNQTWWEQAKAYLDYVKRCQFMLQEGMFISNSSPWIPPGEASDPTQQRSGFSYMGENENTVINYLYRRLDNIDYYFVCNGKRNYENIIATFDAQDKQPEIWHPETGEQYPVHNYKVENGKTFIQLNMQPSESFFIVFDKSIETASQWDEAKDFSKRSVQPVSYQDIQNSFSVSLWLRPDVDVISGKSFILFPVDVENKYGKNHASIGLAVGQNGIRLFEQTGDARQEVLFAETKIEGWSLLNIVYTEGKPTVYINGKKIKEGQKSNRTVHPTGNEISPIDAIYNLFQGEYTTPVIEEKILTTEEIAALYRKGKPLPLLPDAAENIITLNNTWMITFPTNSGVPDQITEKELQSLHLHKDKRVRYFSGTATYTTQFDIPANYKQSGKRIMIDFGNVAFFAEASINGSPIPILWKTPYSYDITDFVNFGSNRLEVKVTNLWTNRLIGDEFFPVENNYDKWGELNQFPDWYINNQPYNGERNTFVSWKQYDKNGPLTESGLIGPVRIYLIKK